MEHAHPTPELLPAAHHEFDSPRPTDHSKAFHSVPATPSGLSTSQPSEVPLSLQHRRLQLRNSGFRATKFPSHRFTARSRWASARAEPEKSCGHSQENQSPAIARQIRHANHGNVSSILQEITNSTQGRQPRKRPDIPIFEDPQEEPLYGESSSSSRSRHSPSSQRKSLPAGSSLFDGEEVAVLREISSNERTPPFGFHMAKGMRRKQKGAYRSRENSNEVSQYIEHLESQLASIQKSMMSPKTGRPIQDKVRKTSYDNRRLRQTIEEWEERFDLRVKQAIEHQAAMESELRRKIKSLEDELILRDCTIRDLQYSFDRTKKDLGKIEALKLSMERLESSKDAVEATNRSLEKRNDVLTELLAQSPTRLLHASDDASTSLNLNARSTPRPRPRPRPKSMVPQPPSSSDSPRTWRPLSLQVSPVTMSESDLLQHQATATPKETGPGIEHSGLDDTIPQLLGVRRLESFSLQSRIDQSSSPRSSVASLSLENSPTVDLPLPLSSPTGKYERATRDRRSRRFAPGSTGLKPLLLPILPGNGPTNLAATPEQPGTILFCQASRRSVDPTMKFASSPDVHETPTQPKRRASTRIDEETLRALEGNSESKVDTFEQALYSNKGTKSDPCHSSFQQLSLFGEIDANNLVPRSLAIARPTQNKNEPNAISCSPERQQGQRELGSREEQIMGLPPSSRIEQRSRPTPPLRLNQGANDTILQDDEPKKQRPTAKSSDCTCLCKGQRSGSNFSPSRLYQLSNYSLTEQSESRLYTTQRRPQLIDKPIPTPSSFFIKRVLSRSLSYYWMYIRELRANPTAFACHVAATVWDNSWKWLGEFPWWVLGLFLGPRKNRQRMPYQSPDHMSHKARNRLGEDNKKSDAVGSHARALDEPSGSSNETSSGVQNLCSGHTSCSCSCQRLTHDHYAPGIENCATQHLDRPSYRGWRRWIYVWGKFSFAIALAIGGALVEGPEEMLKGCDQHRPESDQARGGRHSRSSDNTTSRTACRCLTLEKADSGSDLNNFPIADGTTSEMALNTLSPSATVSKRAGTVIRRRCLPRTLATPPRPSTAPPAPLDIDELELSQENGRFRFSAIDPSRSLISDDYRIATRNVWHSWSINQAYPPSESQSPTPTPTKLSSTTTQKRRLETDGSDFH